MWFLSGMVSNSELLLQMYTVRRLIFGDDLFGEIGEFKFFSKISCRQIITLQSLYIAVLEIAKLILCQIVVFEKPPNIIATKYSRLTVSRVKNIHC